MVAFLPRGVVLESRLDFSVCMKMRRKKTGIVGFLFVCLSFVGLVANLGNYRVLSAICILDASVFDLLRCKCF